MTVQIRRATTDDLNPFLELHAHVHDLHLEQRPDQFKQTENVAIAARFHEWLASPTAKIWVAELAGKCVGYAVAIQIERAGGPYCPARRWCDIDEISVDPAHRRAGIATALMQAIVDSAHAAGIHEIELNSWAFNQTAHRAFESFGFTPKSIRYELKR